MRSTKSSSASHLGAPGPSAILVHKVNHTRPGVGGTECRFFTIFSSHCLPTAACFLAHEAAHVNCVIRSMCSAESLTPTCTTNSNNDGVSVPPLLYHNCCGTLGLLRDPLTRFHHTYLQQQRTRSSYTLPRPGQDMACVASRVEYEARQSAKSSQITKGLWNVLPILYGFVRSTSGTPGTYADRGRGTYANTGDIYIQSKNAYMAGSALRTYLVFFWGGR